MRDLIRITSSSIPVLDSLRAFAALSVCLFHFVCTTTGYFTNPVVLSVFSFGKYGVQLFFVISGFVIPWAMYHAKFKFHNLFTFLLKRLTRLEPPYIISVILAIVVLILRERLLGLQNNQVDISVKQVALHFGYLIPFFEGYKWLNQVYWTLAIEFQYYFFIALLFIPLLKVNRFFRIVVYASIIGISFIGSDAFLLFWLPVFLIGILLFLFKIKHINLTEYLLVMCFVVIFSIYKYPPASVFFMLIPVFSILFLTDVKLAGLHFLGKMSYSIYLIHPIIGASLINILSHHFTQPLAKILVIVAGLLVTIVGALVMYYVIENPSKKLSSRLKYKLS